MKKINHSPTKNVNRRVRLVRAFLCLIFIGIVGRVVYLQLITGGELKAKSLRQTKRNVKINGERGTIYDCNNEKLAVSVLVDSWYANPGEIDDIDKTAATLASILGANPKKIQKLLTKKSNFVWVKRKATPEISNLLINEDIKGIKRLSENRRFYPNMRLAAPLLGFVGIDDTGLGGIEYKYDDSLSGRNGEMVVSKDARGRSVMVNVTEVSRSLNGFDFLLTIDKEIQFITERALENAVVNAEARGGMAVVMNPKTGEILAMANSPSFNPNNFSRFKTEHLRNRIITDVFDPGSIYKAFVAAAAIEEEKAKLSDIFYCENGNYKVGRLTVHDAHKFEWLTLDQVLQKSSNIGMLKLGFNMGPEMIYNYSRAFGFGDKTGVDLPGESSGLIRPYKKWRQVDLATITFGQGVSTTALQLANAFSSIANGGKLMRPYVVKKVLDSEGQTITYNEPHVVRQIVSRQTAAKISHSLEGVVSPNGTGVKAMVPGYSVAGKTGTAQIFDHKIGKYSHKDYNALFCGFLPAEWPELTIMVLIQLPRSSIYGGDVAAPAFREIAQKCVRYLGIKPHRQPKHMLAEFYKAIKEKDNETLSKANVEKKITLPLPGTFPDLKGKTMREVINEVSRLQIPARMEGSGVAISQTPEPGTDMEKVSHCIIKFGFKGEG